MQLGSGSSGLEPAGASGPEPQSSSQPKTYGTSSLFQSAALHFPTRRRPISIGTFCMREMKLQELKAKTPAELVSFAEELEVENASTMRKQKCKINLAARFLRGRIENAPTVDKVAGGHPDRTPFLIP